MQTTKSSHPSRPALKTATSTLALPTHPSPPSLPHPVTPATTIHHANFSHLFWYSFSIHETLNTQLGLAKSHTFEASNLANPNIPASEIQEFHTCRHSFPHVPQRLLSTTRLDGLPSQYLHLT